ncbi:MAG TPA: 5'-methylthioadenosine/S-adenosylhomocysteine nucleosidase [Kofleriaceae bacterium]|nr:5'-methylthioadenosine/S-adenosylhomocysteine nucleosidase [Kofleriaceae bacterium]
MILTVIPAEMEAARRVLQLDEGSREEDPDGTVYFRGTVRSELVRRDYAIALTCIGTAGNPSAAVVAAGAISRHHPRAVLLMGIAAGIRDKVRIGEVVLSDRVVAYEPEALARWADGTKEEHRPEVDRAPHTMIQDVMSYRTDPTRLRAAFERAGGMIPAAATGREEEFRAHVASAITARLGTIASGEKLLRDPSKLLAVRELHGQTEAGEMEAAGLVEACQLGPVPWMVIRGISDFGDELKDDRFHSFASCAAAAVLHDFIAYGLDLGTASSPDADAYVAWYKEALRTITDIINDLSSVIEQDKKDRDLTMLHGAVNRLYRRELELQLAAAPLLTMERSQAFVERLKKTYEPLPSWPGTAAITLDKVDEYRAFTQDLFAALLQRRDDIKSLFDDVLRELGRS